MAKRMILESSVRYMKDSKRYKFKQDSAFIQQFSMYGFAVGLA